MSPDLSSVRQFLLNVPPPSNEVRDDFIIGELDRLRAQKLIQKSSMPTQATTAQTTLIKTERPDKRKLTSSTGPLSEIDRVSDNSVAPVKKFKRPSCARSSSTLSSAAQLPTSTPPPQKRATIVEDPLTRPNSSTKLKPNTTDIIGILASIHHSDRRNITSPLYIKESSTSSTTAAATATATATASQPPPRSAAIFGDSLTRRSPSSNNLLYHSKSKTTEIIDTINKSDTRKSTSPTYVKRNSTSSSSSSSSAPTAAAILGDALGRRGSSNSDVPDKPKPKTTDLLDILATIQNPDKKTSTSPSYVNGNSCTSPVPISPSDRKNDTLPPSFVKRNSCTSTTSASSTHMPSSSSYSKASVTAFITTHQSENSSGNSSPIDLYSSNTSTEPVNLPHDLPPWSAVEQPSVNSQPSSALHSGLPSPPPPPTLAYPNNSPPPALANPVKPKKLSKNQQKKNRQMKKKAAREATKAHKDYPVKTEDADFDALLNDYESVATTKQTNQKPNQQQQDNIFNQATNASIHQNPKNQNQNKNQPTQQPYVTNNNQLSNQQGSSYQDQRSNQFSSTSTHGQFSHTNNHMHSTHLSPSYQQAGANYNHNNQQSTINNPIHSSYNASRSQSNNKQFANPPPSNQQIGVDASSSNKKRSIEDISREIIGAPNPINRANADNAKQAKKRQNNKKEFVPLITCRFFANGHCKDGDACTFKHDPADIVPTQPNPKKNIVCEFFKTGSCCKFDACLYSHDLKLEPCKFFHLNNNCRQNDCPYSHSPLTPHMLTRLQKLTGPCYFYNLKGVCDQGDLCLFSHDSITEDQRLGLEKIIRPCTFFHLEGSCTKDECFFAHEEADPKLVAELKKATKKTTTTKFV